MGFSHLPPILTMLGWHAVPCTAPGARTPVGEHRSIPRFVGWGDAKALQPRWQREG